MKTLSLQFVLMWRQLESQKTVQFSALRFECKCFDAIGHWKKCKSEFLVEKKASRVTMELPSILPKVLFHGENLPAMLGLSLVLFYLYLIASDSSSWQWRQQWHTSHTLWRVCTLNRTSFCWCYLQFAKKGISPLLENENRRFPS